MGALLIALVGISLADAVDGDLWDWLEAALKIIISIPLVGYLLWFWLVRGK